MTTWSRTLGAPSGDPPEEDTVILEGNKMVPDHLVVMHGSWQPTVTFPSVPRRGVTVLQRTEQELPLVRGFRPGGTS